MKRGGFPEPFLAERDEDAMRWRQQYIEGLIREDILDFERIHDLSSMKMLLEMLRRRVGSPLSYRSLSEDLKISPNTVKKYIDILEALFIVFRIPPWSRNIARSIQKEPKLYFFDTGLVVGDAGLLFENMTAVSLYAYTAAVTDYRGVDTGLYYLRTRDGKEVDFCLSGEKGPVEMIECKVSGDKPAANLVYFNERYGIRPVQLVLNLNKQRMAGKVEIRDAADYLSSMPLF
jgi:hypothetical protein